MVDARALHAIDAILPASLDGVGFDIDATLPTTDSGHQYFSLRILTRDGLHGPIVVAASSGVDDDGGHLL